MNDLDKAAIRRLAVSVDLKAKASTVGVFRAMLWQPIFILYMTISREQIAAMYEAAIDIGEDGANARHTQNKVSLNAMAVAWYEAQAPHLVPHGAELQIASAADFDLYTFGQSVPFLIMLHLNAFGDELTDVADQLRGELDDVLEHVCTMLDAAKAR